MLAMEVEEEFDVGAKSIMMGCSSFCSIGDGGGSGSGLKPICKAYGILGFLRFLDCFYLTLITKRAKLGSIGGNIIYTIKSTETFPLKPIEHQIHVLFLPLLHFQSRQYILWLRHLLLPQRSILHAGTKLYMPTITRSSTSTSTTRLVSKIHALAMVTR